MSDDDLDTQLAALPRDVPPVRDLWPGIAGRLHEDRASHRGTQWRSGPARWAAAAAVLVALTAGVTYRWARPPPPPPLVAAGWETQMQSANASLIEVLETRRADLDPETVRVIEDNLQVIDAAIAEVTTALQARPDDRDLTTHLAATWQKRIRLLQQVRDLPPRS